MGMQTPGNKFFWAHVDNSLGCKSSEIEIDQSGSIFGFKTSSKMQVETEDLYKDPLLTTDKRQSHGPLAVSFFQLQYVISWHLLWLGPL